jgi:hypothetical protein
MKRSMSGLLSLLLLAGLLAAPVVCRAEAPEAPVMSCHASKAANPEPAGPDCPEMVCCLALSMDRSVHGAMILRAPDMALSGLPAVAEAVAAGASPGTRWFRESGPPPRTFFEFSPSRPLRGPPALG